MWPRSSRISVFLAPLEWTENPLIMRRIIRPGVARNAHVILRKSGGTEATTRRRASSLLIAPYRRAVGVK